MKRLIVIIVCVLFVQYAPAQHTAVYEGCLTNMTGNSGKFEAVKQKIVVSENYGKVTFKFGTEPAFTFNVDDMEMKYENDKWQYYHTTTIKTVKNGETTFDKRVFVTTIDIRMFAKGTAGYLKFGKGEEWKWEGILDAALKGAIPIGVIRSGNVFESLLPCFIFPVNLIDLK